MSEHICIPDPTHTCVLYEPYHTMLHDQTTCMHNITYPSILVSQYQCQYQAGSAAGIMHHHTTVSILLLIASGHKSINRIQSNINVCVANFHDVPLKKAEFKSWFKPWFESEAVPKTRTGRQLSLDFNLPQESKAAWDSIWTGTGTVPNHLPTLPSHK